jgi:hypothetical protein
VFGTLMGSEVLLTPDIKIIRQKGVIGDEHRSHGLAPVSIVNAINSSFANGGMRF